MATNRDDCYFYYYSTCTKGDSCPFRHCEAAMGSEVMCSLWKENRCFRSECKFRHMEIKKNRKEIPCYWENQPGGCQKPHCAFHHEKSRVLDGLYVPPDKGLTVRKEKEEETPKEDHTPSVPAPVTNPANPQLRGVIKSETQESVPSPTHPPVVINPVDDEDDEDDQISDEGDEASSVSPKKLVSSSNDDPLNFGIKTLEEIRLMKALKASLRRTDHPSNSPGTEKENIRSVMRPAVLATKSEFPTLEDTRKRTVADRLGKVIDKEDISVKHDLRLKGSLAKRLGGFVDMPQKNTAMRPVRERLGTAPDLMASKSNSEPKPPGEIRVKTLEEIRQEKAANSQLQCKGDRIVTEVHGKTSSSTKKENKPETGPFSEIMHEKRMLHEEKTVSQQGSLSPARSEGLENAGTVKEAFQEEVKVKTLEEIRKDKAARMQTLAQATSSSTPSSNDMKKRILHIGKNSPVTPTISQKKPQDSEKKENHVTESVTTNGKSDSSSRGVTVKTFEEIMREKRLRKQKENRAISTSPPQQPEQTSAQAVSEEKQLTVNRPQVTGPAASPLATESLNQANLSVQQIGLKPQTSSSVVVPRKSPEVQAKDSSLAPNPKKLKRLPSAESPGHVADVATSPGFNQKPQMETILETPKLSPGKAMEMKVRPKLNVKPSVIMPAAQVKLGQKRKATGGNCSAVAAVKPLSAVPAPEVELPCKQMMLSVPVCGSEVGASTQQMSSPAQDVSLPRKTTSSVAEPLPAPQSSVNKTPTQTRARRQSVVSSRSVAGNSSMDDFEDLLDEFTDDKLDDVMELDPGKGEDDLLLELSEMIDS